ncbi:hypothetical protein MMSR116_21655 [Methylobacterium mesophilicum SR1.6/6]|uniref:Uncharacterized protein n=1 Tax=Methylobacterium mesophilicum SR1.6/6 TaxID=908290 RepID=A0A6B9FTG2_9HYPH|nr:hypothetical protein [Methylobacterium mesophilicum]QGY04215.1 hypothetical protein MMSR116_21655 [Methylobacterium mesophilicum SR1.6/6]
MFYVVRNLSLGARQIAGILLILMVGWAWICVLDQPALAETPGYMAGALACPPRVEGPDCTRETALDVIVQPVALITECPMVGTVLATHLSLPPGSTHKTFCERRRNGI